MRFLLFFLLFAGTALGQGTVSSTCIWSGTVADCLPADGLLLRNQRDLRLGEADTNGSNYVALQAPAALASDYTLTLPTDDGDNFELLGTNGSGALDWTLINSPSFFTTGAAASATDIGIVDLSTQSFTGVKTMLTGFTVGSVALTAGSVMQVTQPATGNSDYIAKFFKNDTLISAGEAGGIKIGVADNEFNNYKWVGFYKSMGTTADGTEIGYIGTNSDATAVAYVTASDLRLKTNITPLDGGLEKVMRMKPSEFNFKGKEDRAKQVGFIAQELYEVAPDAVLPGDYREEVSAAWAVDYGRITPILAKAIQEQQKMIEDLRLEIQELKAEK